jgi:hypothetical protein
MVFLPRRAQVAWSAPPAERWPAAGPDAGVTASLSRPAASATGLFFSRFPPSIPRSIVPGFP